MKCVNPQGTIEFIAPGDELLPKEEQTILILNQTSADEDAFINDLDGSGSRIMAALHLGLADIKNFPGPDGKMVKLQRDETKRPIVGGKLPWISAQLTLIPWQIRDKAAAKILKGVGLMESEAKNS